ncbi:MAG: helix-turn-helix domain-containing protein [Patescibacteria group bacterium]
MKQNTHLRRHVFTSLGLSTKEARLYDILLEKGTTQATVLEKESGLKKNTYTLLKSLEKKGLVSLIKKDNRKYYQATDPQQLESLVKKQKESFVKLSQSLSFIMPDLKSDYSLNVGKPTIRYFEGEEGLKEIFTDIYAPKKSEVYGCVNLEIADKVFPRYIIKKLIPTRVENKVMAYSLVADSPKAQEMKQHDIAQLRKTILLDKKQFPVPAEIDIYEDKIAMLSFEQDRFIGVIIENKVFAESLRSIFKLVFSFSLTPTSSGDAQLE